jgi:hypothetical protein
VTKIALSVFVLVLGTASGALAAQRSVATGHPVLTTVPESQYRSGDPDARVRLQLSLDHRNGINGY